MMRTPPATQGPSNSVVRRHNTWQIEDDVKRGAHASTWRGCPCINALNSVRRIKVKDVDGAVPTLALDEIQVDLLHVAKGCSPSASTLDGTSQTTR